MATTSREMTKNPIVKRIVELVSERGLKDKDLTDHLGLPPGSMAKWKYDGSQVYLKYIVGISQFLGMSPNYLFLGTEKSDNVEGLTPLENEVIQLYRSIDDRQKKCIRDTLKCFA